MDYVVYRPPVFDQSSGGVLGLALLGGYSMAIRIHIHHHHHFDDESGGLSKIPAMLKALVAQGVAIMGTQQQLVTDMAAVQQQVAKIGGETATTLQKVADLEAALAAGGPTTPEVDAAMAALKEQVKVVDDMVADAPPVTP